MLTITFFLNVQRQLSVYARYLNVIQEFMIVMSQNNVKLAF